MFKIKSLYFVLIIFSFFTSSFSQNIDIGITTNFSSGKISDPYLQLSFIDDASLSWHTFQVGLVFHYDIHDINQFTIKGANKLLYSNDILVNFIVSTDEGKEHYLSAINYFFTLNQSILLSYSLSKIFEVDFGINTQINLLEYEDSYKNIQSDTPLKLGTDKNTYFNFGPIFQINISIYNPLSIVLGSHYNILDHEINKEFANINIGNIYKTKKSLDHFEYNLSIMYTL